MRSLADVIASELCHPDTTLASVSPYLSNDFSLGRLLLVSFSLRVGITQGSPASPLLDYLHSFSQKLSELLLHVHVNCWLAFRSISGPSPVLLCDTGSLALQLLVSYNL